MKQTTDLTEIKLMLLYVIKNLKNFATFNNIINTILNNTIVNYFTLTQNLAELKDDGYCINVENLYENTEKGEKIVEFFVGRLTFSTKKRIDETIFETFGKKVSEIYAEYYPDDNNNFVSECRITENGENLCEIKILSPSPERANQVCSAFYRKSDQIYGMLVKALYENTCYKAVLFDADGTLIDSIADIANTLNEVLDGFNLPIHTINEYKYLVGNGAKALVVNAIPEKLRTDELINKVCTAYKEAYSKNCNSQTRPYEGIPAVLKKIKESGLIIGVVSNKPHEITLDTIHHYFPETEFDFIHGQKDDVPKKPEPDIIKSFCKKYKIKPDEILYFGDTNTDMQFACNTGMFGVGVLWGFRTKDELTDSGAKATISNPKEILKFLSNI